MPEFGSYQYWERHLASVIAVLLEFELDAIEDCGSPQDPLTIGPYGWDYYYEFLTLGLPVWERLNRYH